MGKSVCPYCGKKIQEDNSEQQQETKANFIDVLKFCFWFVWALVLWDTAGILTYFCSSVGFSRRSLAIVWALLPVAIWLVLGIRWFVRVWQQTKRKVDAEFAPFEKELEARLGNQSGPNFYLYNF